MKCNWEWISVRHFYLSESEPKFCWRESITIPLFFSFFATESRMDDDHLQPCTLRHLWCLHPVLWVSQWHSPTRYPLPALLVCATRWEETALFDLQVQILLRLSSSERYFFLPLSCLPLFRPLFSLKITSSWLAQGPTAWRTWSS